MRREGTDESNVQMSDVLCDACGSVWTDERPMVEGHQGSCICGACLTVAYSELVLHPTEDAPTERKCVLCLEMKSEPMWASPVREDAIYCRRCVKQAAAVLNKDKDIPWSKPTV